VAKRVVEEGSHDVLMAQQGAYFNLYQAQARNAETLDGIAGSRP
jgi:ATP-binding cassette subfamily B protein